MLSSFRFAGTIIVIFAVCGLARAQAIAPAGSGVTIDKMDIENGTTHTVKYIVKGGSPRLQALVRRVEWTENELSVVEQLQGLKLDTVVKERSAAQFRTAQLSNPYFPPGFVPPPVATDNGWYGASPLEKALTGQLAYEATPQAAMQLIGFLEQQQTQLDAELKALPPQEQRAVQGPVDALRPRLAALPQPAVPPPPQPQPVVTPPPRLQAVVPRPALAFSPVYPGPMGTTAPLAAPQVSFPGQAVAQQATVVPPDPQSLEQQVTRMQQQIKQNLQTMGLQAVAARIGGAR
jgi:hypothetical protein